MRENFWNQIEKKGGLYLALSKIFLLIAFQKDNEGTFTGCQVYLRPESI